MSKKKSYIIYISLIVVFVIADLLSKIFFANYFAGENADVVVIPNFFTFTFVKNYGAAYGMFADSTLGLTIVSIVLIVVFVVYDIFSHNGNAWYLLGVGGIVGGAIGNLIDRLFLGYVRDFISIKIFSFVFNLADLFITIGVISFAIYMILSAIKESKEKGKKDDKVDNTK